MLLGWITLSSLLIALLPMCSRSDSVHIEADGKDPRRARFAKFPQNTPNGPIIYHQLCKKTAKFSQNILDIVYSLPIFSIAVKCINLKK